VGEFAIIEPLCAVFRRKLRAEGLKYTPERARILDAVVTWGEGGARDGRGANGASGGGGEGGGVFEADQVMQSLRRGGFRVSKATVYRTIKLLAEAGIIQQVLFDADQSHYQLAYGRGSSGLLVRVDTREISTIELPELAALRDRICRERGLEPQGHRLVIYARGGEVTSPPPPR
jgi:Fur family ferric uptake transcriptional regulator